jgi:hypothetical protein
MSIVALTGIQCPDRSFCKVSDPMERFAADDMFDFTGVALGNFRRNAEHSGKELG